MIGPRQNSGLRDYRLSTFCELHGKDLAKFKELFGYKGRFQRMYCLLEILPEFSHEQILRWWYKQRFRNKDNKALAIIGSILVRQYVYIICISPFKTTTKPCPFSPVFFCLSKAPYWSWSNPLSSGIVSASPGLMPFPLRWRSGFLRWFQLWLYCEWFRNPVNSPVEGWGTLSLSFTNRFFFAPSQRGCIFGNF